MKKLSQLQKILEEHYRHYKLGKITEKEYLTRVKPIDQQIGELEMATLQDTPALKGTSLLHFQMQER